MTAAPWAYGAERDGYFVGVCAADSTGVGEFLAECAEWGDTILTFHDRDEYDRWLRTRPVLPAHMRGKGAERAKRGE